MTWCSLWFGLSLCSGGVRLDVGLDLAEGQGFATACFVEWENTPDPSSSPRMRAMDTTPEAPIWDNVKTLLTEDRGARPL